MNKMNIPAPFRMALPMPPLPPPVPAPVQPPPPPITEGPPPPDISSEESELESSDEDISRVERRKRRRRESIVGPAIDKGVAHEDVGLKPTSLVPKEVPLIKKKNPILQIKIAPKMVQTENKAEDVNMAPEIETPRENAEVRSFATQQEIESGKLPLEEILSLPKFKAYAAGNPNNVLYIKNLAKDVIIDDFYYIFGFLFGSSEAARAGLHVKLMQEGRMRDQAFMTFPSVELAHLALDLVNGYVFKGKPMVIQFGRKSETKTT